MSSRDQTNTTGIRSKSGLIPDEYFENDAGGAVGDPILSADEKRLSEERIARLNRARAKILNRPDLDKG